MNLQKATGVVFAVALFAFSLSTSPALSSEPFEITKSGVMRYLELEGGCWQFQADDGTTYEPYGGDETLYLEDTSYIISGLVRPDLDSICMVGTVLDVQEFEIAEDEITVFGIMRYIPLEGGCWQLATLGGQYYEPVFGSEDLYKDGKKVVVRGIARPGLISICMVGTMLIVTESFFEPCGTFVVPTGNLEGAILALIPILIPGLLVLILKRKYR